VEKRKELAHAIELAARIQEKTLALAKANWRRGPRMRLSPGPKPK